MITRSVTVTAGISRVAKFQKVKFEVSEQVDLEPGDDRDEVIASIRQRLFQDVDEVTMRGIVNVANRKIE